MRDLAATQSGVWVTCAGRSMEPTIKRGDRVRIKACQSNGRRGIRSGDVVLFEASRSYVLHRVVFVVPGTGWFVHVGDAGSNNVPGLAHCSTIVGRACLPRRRPSLPLWWAAVKRLGYAAQRRLARGQFARL